MVRKAKASKKDLTAPMRLRSGSLKNCPPMEPETSNSTAIAYFGGRVITGFKVPRSMASSTFSLLTLAPIRSRFTASSLPVRTSKRLKGLEMSLFLDTNTFSFPSLLLSSRYAEDLFFTSKGWCTFSSGQFSRLSRYRSTTPQAGTAARRLCGLNPIQKSELVPALSTWLTRYCRQNSSNPSATKSWSFLGALRRGQVKPLRICSSMAYRSTMMSSPLSSLMSLASLIGPIVKWQFRWTSTNFPSSLSSQESGILRAPSIRKPKQSLNLPKHSFQRIWSGRGLQERRYSAVAARRPSSIAMRWTWLAKLLAKRDLMLAARGKLPVKDRRKATRRVLSSAARCAESVSKVALSSPTPSSACSLTCFTSRQQNLSAKVQGTRLPLSLKETSTIESATIPQAFSESPKLLSTFPPNFKIWLRGWQWMASKTLLLSDSRGLSRSTSTWNLSLPLRTLTLQGLTMGSLELGTGVSIVAGEAVKMTHISWEQSSLGRGECMRSRLQRKGWPRLLYSSAFSSFGRPSYATISQLKSRQLLISPTIGISMSPDLRICGQRASSLCFVQAPTTGILKLVRSNRLLLHISSFSLIAALLAGSWGGRV